MSNYAISQIRRNSDLSEKVIYQIVFKMFTVEGTISAAIKKLQHVADIGVDIIYLSPFFEADDDMDRNAWSERQKMSGITFITIYPS